MSNSRLFLLVAILVIAVVHPAWAENSIVVESRNFELGQTTCTLGIWLTNDVPIAGLVLPVEARSLTGGAFHISGGTTGPISQPLRRLDASPLGLNSPTGVPASITRRRYSTPTSGCGGPVSHSWTTAVASVDGISPDGFLYSCVSQGDPGAGDDIDLDPGADNPSRDSASWVYVFNANNFAGCFEIDTSCITPSGHIGFVDASSVFYLPAFTKGVVCLEGTPVNQPPVVTCPDDVVEQAQPGETGATVTYSVTVVDEDPLLVADCNPLSGSFFSIGTTLVTCIATDTAGLADTCSFDVTINPPPPNQPPVVHCPGGYDHEIVSPGASGAVANFAATVSDDGPPLQATCTPASGSFFPLGVTLVECVATDAEGLADTCRFHVYVSDVQSSEVRVESRTFAPGQTGCEVGVYLTNHVPVDGFVMQLELRSVSGGAFYQGPVGSSFFRVQPGQRLDASPLGTANPPQWPEATMTSRRFDTSNTINSCSGPISHTWGKSVVAVGGTSPDAIEFATVSTGDPESGQQIALAPGSDIPFTSGASFVFTFDADSIEGCFEIDTACTTPSNHLGFVSAAQLVLPSFTKGTVCISSCICDCHANPAACSDPAVNVLDVLYTVNVAFRGFAEIDDNNPLCPIKATDVNCDGVSSVIDVIKMVDVAFRAGDPAEVFCDPCP